MPTLDDLFNYYDANLAEHLADEDANGATARSSAARESRTGAELERLRENGGIEANAIDEDEED